MSLSLSGITNNYSSVAQTRCLDARMMPMYTPTFITQALHTVAYV